MKTIFLSFKRGRFTQVLLYVKVDIFEKASNLQVFADAIIFKVAYSNCIERTSDMNQLYGVLAYQETCRIIQVLAFTNIAICFNDK